MTKKHFLTYMLSILLSSPLLAENLSWENSLKREFDFIESQKKALTFQLLELQRNFEKEKNEIRKKNESLVRLNTELKEEIQIWNFKNEELKRIQSFKLDKFETRLSKIQSEVSSLLEQKNVKIKEKEITKVDDFKKEFDLLSENLEQLNRVQLISTTVLNEEKGLEETLVLAIGPLMSFKLPMTPKDNRETIFNSSLTAGKSFFSILIPTEFGYLNSTHIQGNNSVIGSQYFKTNAFIYDQFNKGHKILKEKNWADHLADFLPAAFLLIVFSCVGWIFLVLTKV